MRKICKNCICLSVLNSKNISEYWGDCLNPKYMENDGKEKGKPVFTWEDRTCPDFKPITDKQ